MPQWLTGIIVGVVVAWLTQWLQTVFRKSQYRYEKLMERYAEFVAIASSELDRARSLRAGLALSGPSSDNSALIELDAKRHQLRQELAKLAFQIRLVESDAALSSAVTELAKVQPFIAPYPAWHQGNFNERFDDFQKEINQFGALLENLVQAVLRRHASTVTYLGDTVRQQRLDR